MPSHTVFRHVAFQPRAKLVSWFVGERDFTEIRQRVEDCGGMMVRMKIQKKERCETSLSVSDKV